SVLGPIYSAPQLAFVAAFSLLLYLTFVFVQTVGNRDYFLPKGNLQSEPDAHATPPSDFQTWLSFGTLLVSLGAVVLMAKTLSPTLEAAVAQANAPRAVVGVAIAALQATAPRAVGGVAVAAIVLRPEGVAAARAARANRLQTSLNLALGSAL